MSHKGVNPIPGPLRSRPPKAGDRSSRHAGIPAGIPGSAGVSGNPKPGPHSRHRDLPANGLRSGDRRSLIHHESQSIIWKPDSSSRESALRSPGCHPPPLIVASGNGTAAIRQPRPPETLGVRYSRNATGGKSSNTVAATNIGDGSERPNPFNVRPVHVRLNGRLLHSSSLPWQWNRPSPAPGAALRMFFVGGQGRRAARRPSGRRPSRFPRHRVPRTERD